MREALAIALLSASALWGQGGARMGTFRSTTDGTDQPYALFAPRELDPARKYPLVVSLHSEDTNPRLNLRQVFGLPIRSGEVSPDDLRYFPVRDAGYFVVAPLARGTLDYRGIGEQDVYDALADIERRYPIDPDRIYLTGVSMGGAAAIRFALTRPDVWAAVAAVCPAEVWGVDGLSRNASNLPIRIYHGEQDPVTPVANSRAWQRRLVDAGVPAEYIEYPAVRHNAWDVAYRGGGVFEWFGRFRRNRAPDRVRLVARSYRHAAAYWARIDGLTPGVLAGLDVRRSAPNEIAVETENVDGFTLTPEKPAASVSIDGAVLRVRPGAPLSFHKAGERWRAGLYIPAGKRPGAEGPIVAAVNRRHIYVYGSVGAATADELAERRAVAEQAASWSSPRGYVGVKFEVKADTAVSAADLDDADLVLFGTPETNAVVARLAPRFPITLNPGAADYGLLFVIPDGARYALVSSGLPWWTGADDARRSGPPFAPDQYRLLATFGDYILFKGSLANVVEEGRFDSNWKVPAGNTAKMLGTGTVTIR